MSSPYVNKTKLVLRMNDNVDTGENTRRIHSEEPILQIDISNRKKIDITKKIQEKRKEIQKLYINNLGASKYWRSERKPSPLRRLEEGMIKFFFKEDSNVLGSSFIRTLMFSLAPPLRLTPKYNQSLSVTVSTILSTCDMFVGEY